jgi:hypothetical protein
MAKEYGRLTAGQFRQLIGTLPEVRSQGAEFSEALAKAPKEKLDVILLGGYN